MSNGPDHLFIALFPILFLGMWLFVTTLLGVMSGWFELQQHYPRGNEPALLKLRWVSGSMGLGVSMNGILILIACESGLRIGVSRLFGPFQRPFLVPWKEIDAEATTSFFAPTTRLQLGRPKVGSLKLDARTWQRLAEASPNAPSGSAMHVSRSRAAQGFLLQWAAMSLVAGAFFYFASHGDPHQLGLPVAICFGFPATVFGMAQGIRFLRQVR